MKSLFIVFILTLLAFPVAYADIYKYVDENGVICYTDTPFGKKANKVLKDTTSTPISAEQTINNSELNSIVHEKAEIYNIDPSIIKAVIETESNWNSRAISNKGAMGLMQLMPSTAIDMNVSNPFDPEENIEGGTKYLKYLLEKFNGDLILALAAYNAGPKAVEKYGYVPPYTETKQYVKKVLDRYNGSTNLSNGNNSAKRGSKNTPIYKIELNDGTVLFTNSSLFAKNPASF